MKGLFLNSSKKQCSIHESGIMIFECLKKVKKCNFDYIEIDKDNCKIPTGYDLYFFNYHYGTMSWLDVKKLRKSFGYVMTVVMEVSPDDPFPFVSRNDFNVFCVIDPTIKSNGKDIFSFPRPLEKFTPKPLEENSIPIIGSFGFPAPNKGFDKIVEAVNKEFDRAIVRINLPYGDFMPFNEDRIKYWSEKCIIAAKEGVEVQITSVFMDKNELIEWCSENTINCFFYDRNAPGLCATTDQAISSGRPLSVVKNSTFRHILEYISPYPEWSLKQSIANTPEIIKKLQENWNQEVFTQKFDDMIRTIMPDLKENKLKDSRNKMYKLKKINIIKNSMILIKNILIKIIWKLRKYTKRIYK